MAYELLPFPNADKVKTLVAEAEERFRAAEEAKKEREDLYRKGYKHKRTVLKRTKDWKFSTLIADPVLFSAIKTKSARMKKAIFSSNPVVRYKPEGDSLAQDDEKARGMTQMFGHYQRQDKPRLKTGSFLEALSLAGTQFVMWHWLYEEADVTREVEVEATEMVDAQDAYGNPIIDPVTGDFAQEAVTVLAVEKQRVREPIVDRPTWTSIHFTEAFPDATALGIHDGDFFIRRTFKDEAHCEKMAKLSPEQGGWNKKAVKAAIKRGCSVSLEEIRKNLQWQTEAGLGSQTGLQGMNSRNFVEVWEVYRQQKLLCYTVLNRCDVAAYKRVSNRLGRIPIDMVKCHAEDNEFWGVSDYELLEKNLLDYQDQRNAGATETLLSVFGLTTAQPGFQHHKLLHEPGVVIPVASHDDIRFQPRPAPGVSLAQNQMGIARAAMDEVTASSEAFRGISPRESRTATTDSLANQGAGLRLQDLIDDFEEQFIVPWGEWWLCLMQEHADPETVRRILKDEAAVAAFYEDRALDVVSGAQSSEIRALEDKRMLETIEIQGKFKFPFVDEREQVKAYLERTIPEKVDVVIMDDEKMLQREIEKLEMQTKLQIAQIQAQAQVQKAQMAAMPPPPQPGMPPPGGPGGPMAGDEVEPMGEPMMDAGMASEAAMMGAEAGMGGM